MLTLIDILRVFEVGPRFFFSKTHIFENGGFKHKFCVLSRLTFTPHIQMGHYF